MKEIRERFAVIEDERHQGYIAHNLADVLTLGHELIHEKTNEIPVFQKMLSYLNIAGKTITADALHCQKETCRKIISQKGNYVFGLKGNHRTLFEDVSLFLSGTINMDSVETHTTVEKPAICLGWKEPKNGTILNLFFPFKELLRHEEHAVMKLAIISPA